MHEGETVSASYRLKVISTMATILIVEDNASFRHSLVSLLSQRFPSMTIVETADGNEALQKVHVLAPDLVFMDIRLPGENGLELTRRIKEEHPKTIIVILTSHNLQEYREAAYRYGASHFLAKGTSSGEEIVRVVESIAPASNASVDCTH